MRTVPALSYKVAVPFKFGLMTMTSATSSQDTVDIVSQHRIGLHHNQLTS